MRALLLLIFLVGHTFGASQFGTPFYLHAYGGVTQTVTNDFNGDHIVDIASVGVNDPLADNGALSVLLSRPDGTFSSRTYFPGDGVWALTANDLTGDGHPDIAVACTGRMENRGTIVLLVNDGTGNFATTILRESLLFPRGIVSGDWDHDGRNDIAYNYGYESSTIAILLGIGEGTFTNGVELKAAAWAPTLAASDLDNDGWLDFALPLNNSSVQIWFGNTTAQFNSTLTLPLDAVPSAVKIADLNGNGHPDLLFPHLSEGFISVYNNSGSRNFAYNRVGNVGGVDVAVGDFNRDGTNDLALALANERKVSLFTGTGNGNFTFSTNYTTTGQNVYWLDSADINGDGKADLLAGTSFTDFPVVIFPNDAEFGRLQLSASTIAANKLRFFWPITGPGYQLESSPELNRGEWSPLTETVSTNTDSFSVVVPLSQTNQFFRLAKP